MTNAAYVIDGMVLQRLSDDAIRVFLKQARISARRVQSAELAAVGRHYFDTGRRIFFERSDWRTYSPPRFGTAKGLAVYQRWLKRNSGNTTRKKTIAYVGQTFVSPWCMFKITFLNDFGAKIIAEVWIPERRPVPGALSAFTF